MKVKNPLYLRSLTALLRSPIKNPSEPNESCEPWYAKVPSVTYFWTHRPQWRRRHKKRKQSNPPRFPVPTYSRLNDALLDTLKILERPISRASTSPYETCSSKQIATDSESPRNNNSSHLDDWDRSGDKKKRESHRCPSASECHSDSGLRKLREQQIIRLIRSQRRLGGARNVVASSETGTAKFRDAEVKQTVRSFHRCESLLNCVAPKRHVTFNNCVSTESSVDRGIRRNPKIRGIDGHLRRQGSYVPLSEDDDDDDFSLQTDLDNLFSSMIFNLSSKSSLSVESFSRKAEKEGKTEWSSLHRTCESVFYINSSYLRKSPSDLLSIKLHPDKFVQQKIDEKKDSEVTKAPTKHRAEGDIVSNFLKKSLDNDHDSTYQRSIERIIFELKNLADQKMAPPPRGIDHGSILCGSASKINISTDTSDLIDIYCTPSSSRMPGMPRTLLGNAGFNIRGIIDLIEPPIGRTNAIFHELSAADKKAVAHFEPDKKTEETAEKILRYGNKGNPESQVGGINLLRIETETDGELESIFVEMKDLRGNLREENPFENLLPRETGNCTESVCAPLVNNLLPQARSHSESSTASSHRNDHKSCSIDECCTICGRTKFENPRYLRPVCRVKGVTLYPRLENDPWINVVNRINKHESVRKMVQQQVRGNDRTEGPGGFSNKLENAEEKIEINGNDGILADEEKEEFECFSILVTDTDHSISTDDSNSPGSREQSTSCSSPESGLDSLSSYDCGTRLRGQLAKAYCARESVRTVNVTSNRLLCVISESDALMGLPQFLPKKPPDWFPRQVPSRKSARR